jgi:hypothetical protein
MVRIKLEFAYEFSLLFKGNLEKYFFAESVIG